jgi:uncharacterized protein YecE (DUF72 family)
MIFNHNVPAEAYKTPAERIADLLAMASQMERECTELFYRHDNQEMMQALNQLKALKATLHDANENRESMEQAETTRLLKMKARLAERNR